MDSIMKQICRIRKNEELNIDYSNSNRYRVLVREPNGTKTAYCFSTPIYNQKTRKLLDLKFRQEQSAILACGSNADITIGNEVVLENAGGYCRLSLKKTPSYVTDQLVLCGRDQISLTTNGIVYKADIQDQKPMVFNLTVNELYKDLRVNDVCFAVMKEKFKPFLTVSTIGVSDANGIILAPAKIQCKTIGNGRYELTFDAGNAPGKYILFELNLYEDKIIQDTTVESGNPQKNNAFGSTAFIGKTDAFGEQWLYLRPDFSNMMDLMKKNISKATLYFPKFNVAKVPIQGYKAVSRFCSFGSNWSNKIPTAPTTVDAVDQDGFLIFDIKELATEQINHQFVLTSGLILKPQKKDGGFAAIATGDNYFAPMIFEINYK